MGWLDDWIDILDDIDWDDINSPGYPENDYRRGESILTWWTLDPTGCGVLGFALFVPWLTQTLAVLSICVFIWEIDRRGVKVLWFILALIASILAFLDSNFIIAALYNSSYSWGTVLTLLEAGRVTAWATLVVGTISFFQCLVGLCCWPAPKVSPTDNDALAIDPNIVNLPPEYQQDAIENRKKVAEQNSKKDFKKFCGYNVGFMLLIISCSFLHVGFMEWMDQNGFCSW